MKKLLLGQMDDGQRISNKREKNGETLSEKLYNTLNFDHNTASYFANIKIKLKIKKFLKKKNK